jgi:methyl-accepting chemotaxis protein
MKKVRYRRRNFFIKKDLQGRYIFRFFIYVIAGSVAFSAILAVLSSNTMTMVYDNNVLTIGKTPAVLLKDILRAHWIFIVTGGIVVSVLSMFLTHRFAGPIFKIERTVDEMATGRLDIDIYLRRNDEAKELAEKLNMFNSKLSGALSDMRKLSDGVEDCLSGIKLAGNDEELKRALELNAGIRKMLRGYKLKNDK